MRTALTGWMAATLWSCAAMGQTGAVQSLDIVIPVAPQPVRIGETLHVFYELHLTNFSTAPVTLTDLAVLDGSTSAPLGRFEGEPLAALLGRPDFAKDAEPRTLPGETYGVIYMSLPLSQAAPAKLSHRIGVTVVGRIARRSTTLSSDIVPIDTTALPELSPPLKGGTWAALYQPSMERGHRRVFYAVDGRARIPGRFAMDFFGVDAEGKTHKGSGERPSDYFGYGADVFAVSDGVVVAARDDFTEPATLADIPDVSLGDATGVYVTLDIGGGRFAFYEHLQPGLAVKIGQQVRRGQRLGKLGLTGSSSAPHLHFHVANANAPLAAEGMPYHFTSYRLLGAYRTIEEYGEKPWQALPAPRVISKSMPAPNVVVSFDAS